MVVQDATVAAWYLHNFLYCFFDYDSTLFAKLSHRRLFGCSSVEYLIDVIPEAIDIRKPSLRLWIFQPLYEGLRPFGFPY